MKNLTVKIRNIDYKLSELKSFSSKRVIDEVVNYKLDPNCSADLWVSDPILNFTEKEKAEFIYLVNHIKE